MTFFQSSFVHIDFARHHATLLSLLTKEILIFSYKHSDDISDSSENATESF